MGWGEKLFGKVLAPKNKVMTIQLSKKQMRSRNSYLYVKRASDCFFDVVAIFTKEGICYSFSKPRLMQHLEIVVPYLMLHVEFYWPW